MRLTLLCIIFAKSEGNSVKKLALKILLLSASFQHLIIKEL